MKINSVKRKIPKSVDNIKIHDATFCLMGDPKNVVPTNAALVFVSMTFENPSDLVTVTPPSVVKNKISFSRILIAENNCHKHFQSSDSGF